MPHIATKEVFYFNELDDSAKEAAREWYRLGAFDYEWWDCTYEDAKTIAALMGIDTDNIYFSGFWSQGDGACFTGSYAYKKGAAKAVKDYAPVDKELARIVDELQAIQKKHFYQLSATVNHSGHYYHEYCTSITVWNDGTEADEDTADCVSELLRDFMRWIYRRLESEYEYLNSDETVDEMIDANQYQFTEDGSIYS
jgi:hypothetical protein